MKIAIEGNIGSGKSTIITRLCQEKRIPVFLEPVHEWKDWLTLFYQDSARWGLAFNLHVLLTFNQWKNNEFPAVYERSPISNKNVFTQLAYEQGRMNELEMTLFSTMYGKLAWEPDIVIYIRTDPEVSMKRMEKRARSCESSVPLEYLRDIHNKHECLFNNGHKVMNTTMSKNNKTTIYIVDGNRSEDDVYADVVSVIRMYF
jgi:deoxyadenosine/deoxycytidine kinase